MVGDQVERAPEPVDLASIMLAQFSVGLFPKLFHSDFHDGLALFFLAQ